MIPLAPNAAEDSAKVSTAATKRVRDMIVADFMVGKVLD